MDSVTGQGWPTHVATRHWRKRRQFDRATAVKEVRLRNGFGLKASLRGQVAVDDTLHSWKCLSVYGMCSRDGCRGVGYQSGSHCACRLATRPSLPVG